MWIVTDVLTWRAAFALPHGTSSPQNMFTSIEDLISSVWYLGYLNACFFSVGGGSGGGLASAVCRQGHLLPCCFSQMRFATLKARIPTESSLGLEKHVQLGQLANQMHQDVDQRLRLHQPTSAEAAASNVNKVKFS